MAGVILGAATIAIEDATGGIYVRLPDPAAPGYVLGAAVDVIGAIAAPYGNLELRPATGGATVVGSASVPAPVAVASAQLGEATEGLLVSAQVTVVSVESSSTGTLTLMVDGQRRPGPRLFPRTTRDGAL